MSAGWLKAALFVFAIGLVLVPLPRGLVERLYASGVYPKLQPLVTSLSNATSLAWFDVFVCAGLAALGAVWVRGLRRWRHGRVAAVRRIAVNTIAVLAVVYLWFLLAWGLNYQRLPLTARLDYDERRITADALRELAERTAVMLNSLHEPAHRHGWRDDFGASLHMRNAWRAAEANLRAGWHIEPAHPKLTLWNFYFARVSIDGMTAPFFLETLVNAELLPFERPATIAHEWAHLAGFAHESEASFAAWLPCTSGPAPLAYSGWLSIYPTVVNALGEPERRAVASTLSAGPRADLQAVADRIRRSSIPAASRAGYAAYDRFLKANRVDAGIRSYSEVLRLLLGTAFDAHGAPRLRGDQKPGGM